ncbi:hypothetical protein C8J57DRAFT_1579235 [Mycena rebaudengoi]|nr:hypothetical protein C8J57DRAFT_1579235 [Mycena rebaudengoi]
MTLQSLYALGYYIHRPVWARQSTHNVRARSEASHGTQGGGAAPRAGSSLARIADMASLHTPRSRAAAQQNMSPYHTPAVPRHLETRARGQLPLKVVFVPDRPEAKEQHRHTNRGHGAPPYPRSRIIAPYQRRPHPHPRRAPPTSTSTRSPLTSTLRARGPNRPSTSPPPLRFRPTPRKHVAAPTHDNDARSRPYVYEAPQDIGTETAHADDTDTARRIKIPASAASCAAPHPSSAAPSNACAQSAAWTPLAAPPLAPVRSDNPGREGHGHTTVPSLRYARAHPPPDTGAQHKRDALGSTETACSGATTRGAGRRRVVKASSKRRAEHQHASAPPASHVRTSASRATRGWDAATPHE